MGNARLCDNNHVLPKGAQKRYCPACSEEIKARRVLQAQEARRRDVEELAAFTAFRPAPAFLEVRTVDGSSRQRFHCGQRRKRRR